MDFIDNSSIDGSCINKGKLHLNRKGKVALAKNLCRFVRSLPVHRIITGCESAFIRQEDNSSENHSDISKMENLPLKNPKTIFFLYLDINAVQNNFKNMSSLILENVDILIVAETKLESSFPMAQFLIPGFHHPF